MIKLEPNTPNFALTNDQFFAIVGIVGQDDSLDYDITEHDVADGIVWLYAYPEGSIPVRHWIEIDGSVSLTEDCDWMGEEEGVGTPTPSDRVEMEALYPKGEGETPEAWTRRVLSHSAEHEVNRQCSIGYHGECSDRSGESCRCLCHDDATRWFTVEGHPEGEAQVISRIEQGKAHWPPVPGEPPGTWAEWVMATSPTDASNRSLKKQEARRG